MTAEARAAQREYLRQWRAKNKDKVKRYSAEYWQRKATQKAANKEE